MTDSSAVADVSARKAALRETIIGLRDALDGETRARASASIVTRLFESERYASATSVASFVSFSSEVDLEAFNEAVIASERRLLLPRMEGPRRLGFHRVSDLADLVAGRWGIRQPDPERCPLLDIGSADLVVVPGVAFSHDGWRLGYGGGFYDAVITSVDRQRTIGVCFTVQIVDEVPREPHDRAVGVVIAA